MFAVSVDEAQANDGWFCVEPSSCECQVVAAVAFSPSEVAPRDSHADRHLWYDGSTLCFRRRWAAIEVQPAYELHHQARTCIAPLPGHVELPI